MVVILIDTAHTLKPTQMVRIYEKVAAANFTVVTPELFGYMAAPLYLVLN